MGTRGGGKGKERRQIMRCGEVETKGIKVTKVRIFRLKTRMEERVRKHINVVWTNHEVDYIIILPQNHNI